MNQDVPEAILALHDSDDAVVTTLSVSFAAGKWIAAFVDGASHDDRVQDIVATLRPESEQGSDIRPKLITLIWQAGLKPVVVQQTIAGQFQLDAATGTFVGKSEPVFATVDDNAIGQKLHKAVSEVLAQAASNAVKDVQSGALNVDAINTKIVDALLLGINEDQKLKLLSALRALDLQQLDAIDRMEILRRRVYIAADLELYDEARVDVLDLLENHGEKLTSEDNLALQTLLAIYAALHDQAETALLKFQDLLKEAKVPPAQRGFLYRNISLTLDTNDPAAALAARHSADAFVEAGEKLEAGRSLHRLHDCLEVRDPVASIAPLAETVALWSEGDLASCDYKASALYAKALKCSSAGLHKEAFSDAKEAVRIYRGLLGRKAQLTMSLQLAAIDGALLGDPEAATISSEADALAKQPDKAQFERRNDLIQLLDKYDAKRAAEIAAEVAGNAAYEMLMSIRLIQAIRDEELTVTEKISNIEEVIANAKGVLKPDTIRAGRFAIAALLDKGSDRARAGSILKQLTESKPADVLAFQQYLSNLWARELWSDGAVALAKRIQILGEAPGLLFAYGKSLHMSGDSETAIPILEKARSTANPGSDVESAAKLFLAKALATGAKPRYVNATIAPAPITLGNVRDALGDFARFVSGEIRMKFWRHDKWVSAPEGRGEDHLHGFLRARFGERVLPFRQIASGAGRVDLYVQFGGDLAVVIELKMCGGGYDSQYAASGEDQLLHYMPYLGCHVGFLVVFDARLEDCGSPFLSAGSQPKLTIEEVSIDMRPRISKRKRKKWYTDAT